MRNATESVRVARSHKTFEKDMCARFVWTCIAAPKVYGMADANAAWSRATGKRTTGTPPAGVPVYWGPSKHGHIAISVGGGRVRSTDYPTNGTVGEGSIEAVGKRFGLAYRGWSTDFGGDAIPGVGGAGGGFNPASLRLGKASPEARVFNAKVWAYVQRHEPTWAKANAAKWAAESAGTFGPMTQAAMRKAYASLNRRNAKAWPASQTTTPPPAYPGPAFLKEIGCP